MIDNPNEYDGLVVEGANGVRLVAIPMSLLQVLQYAEVVQFTKAGVSSRLRVSNFLPPEEMRTMEQAAAEAAQEAAEQASNSAAAVVEAQVIQLRPDPSPTPPPPLSEPVEDPANIPLRVYRDGQWVTIHVTRAQYEEYERQGKISQNPPPNYEGNEPS